MRSRRRCYILEESLIFQQLYQYVKQYYARFPYYLTERVIKAINSILSQSSPRLTFFRQQPNDFCIGIESINFNDYHINSCANQHLVRILLKQFHRYSCSEVTALLPIIVSKLEEVVNLNNVGGEDANYVRYHSVLLIRNRVHPRPT